VEKRWHKIGNPTVRVFNLVPFHVIWGIDEFRVGEKERFISNRILEYIEF